LVGKTSDKVKYAGCGKSNLPFLSRAFLTLQTSIGAKAAVDEVRFEKPSSGGAIRLKGKNLKKMLTFTLYMGENSRLYRDLLDTLECPGNAAKARDIIRRISALETGNQYVKRDIERACTSLLKSLSELEEGTIP
jgi:hypothetical protein